MTSEAPRLLQSDDFCQKSFAAQIGARPRILAVPVLRFRGSSLLDSCLMIEHLAFLTRALPSCGRMSCCASSRLPLIPASSAGSRRKRMVEWAESPSRSRGNRCALGAYSEQEARLECARLRDACAAGCLNMGTRAWSGEGSMRGAFRALRVLRRAPRGRAASGVCSAWARPAGGAHARMPGVAGGLQCAGECGAGSGVERRWQETCGSRSHEDRGLQGARRGRKVLAARRALAARKALASRAAGAVRKVPEECSLFAVCAHCGLCLPGFFAPFGAIGGGRP